MNREKQLTKTARELLDALDALIEELGQDGVENSFGVIWPLMQATDKMKKLVK